MKKIFNWIPVACAALAMVSCNSDDLFTSNHETLDPSLLNENEAIGTFAGAGTTRSGVITNPADASQMAVTWTKGDKFNLYSTNSLKFNSYVVNEDSYGSTSGKFTTAANNLDTKHIDASEAENLFAVVDDSGKGLVHSFFTDVNGKANVSIKIPSRFTQNADALYTEESKATALCLPIYAHPVTLNANGGVTAEFKWMSGLLTIDAGNLPAGAQGIVVVAKNISGTFEANLEDATPAIASDDSRYAYKNYIQVDFPAATAAAGARMIYVPIAPGTYKHIYVYVITAKPTAAADLEKDALATITMNATTEVVSAKTTNTNWTVADDAIIDATNVTITADTKTPLAQAVELTATANSWATLSNEIATRMLADPKHEIKFTVASDASAWADAPTLWIDNTTANNVSVEFTDANGLAAATQFTLTVKEGKFTAASGATPASWTATTATASAAAQRTVTVKATAKTGNDAHITAILPTSKFVFENADATTNTWAGTITSQLTATDGMIVKAGHATAAVATAPANTGKLEIASGTVTALTLTAGDGDVKVDAGATVTNAVSIPAALAGNVEIAGTLGNTLTVAVPVAPATAKYAGTITIAKGATVTGAFTNNGTGDIDIYGTVASLDSKTTSKILVGYTAGEPAVKGVVTGTLSVDNILQTEGVTVNGTVGTLNYGSNTGLNYVKTGVNEANANSGAITIGSTGTVTTLNYYGTGDITVNGAITTLNNNGKGDITVDVTPSANQAITTIKQAAAGKNVSIKNNSTSKTLTVNTLDIDEATTVSIDNATVNTLDATDAASKVVNSTLTNAYVETMNFTGATVASQVTAYGSAIGYIDDANDKVTVKAYWNGTKKSNFKVTSGVKWIYTAGQLAGLVADAANTYKVSSKVILMDLNGSDNKQIWEGATVNGQLTLDGNYVAIQSMNLTKTSLTSNVGLIRQITGSAAVTISNIYLSGVYYNGSASNVGALIGDYASGGALDIDDVVISDIEEISSTGHNVAGLIGSASGLGAISIDGVGIDADKIKGAYNVAGLIGINAGNVTFGTNNNVVVSVDAYEQAGTYSLPAAEYSTQYGTFSNLIGQVATTGTVTINQSKITASYDFTAQAAMSALHFQGNYKWNTAGTKKRAYTPTTKFVGYISNGTVNGGAIYNDYTDWYTYE